MSFVQELLTGIYPDEGAFVDLHLTTRAPKTVTLGNTIYVWRTGRDYLPDSSCVDNLGNTYTLRYHNTNFAEMFSLYTAEVIVAGALTDIDIPANISAFHSSGCSAEFTDAADDPGMDVTSATGGGITSVTRNIGLLGPALILCGVSVLYDASGFVPPDGFQIASQVYATDGALATSSILMYRYGVAQGDLIASWTDPQDSAAMAAGYLPWTPPFVPDVYRYESP